MCAFAAGCSSQNIPHTIPHTVVVTNVAVSDRIALMLAQNCAIQALAHRVTHLVLQEVATVGMKSVAQHAVVIQSVGRVGRLVIVPYHAEYTPVR